MPTARTHYETLNVSPDAEIVVIEAAYRALMKKYHPDQASAPLEGAPAAAEINAAYRVLRDPEARTQYDRTEWIRQKDFRIAQYNALEPPRASKFFGWGGWLVSLLLTGMIAIMASKSEVPQLARAEAAKAASLPLPEPRSQPSEPSERVLRAAEEETAADMRFNAFRQNQPPSQAPAPRAELPAVRPPAAAPASSVRRYAAPRPARYRILRHAARPRTAAEKDFLARQGYIY